MNTLKILALMFTIISMFILSGCGASNSYEEIYVPADKQETNLSSSDNIKPSSEDKKYEPNNLIKDPNIENAVTLIDGKKYKFDVISTQEQGIIGAVEGKQNSEEISQFLQAIRIKRGGVPLGFTNSVIEPGRKLNGDDLRLGYIDIDEDIASVVGKLGEPRNKKNKDNNKVLYTYELETNKSYIEITFKNNKVDSIVSCGEDITTPRGISASGKIINGKDHKPNTTNISFIKRDDVMSFYDVGYNITDYEDMELIEYTVNSKNGQPCILRFAVNKSDQYIYYISIRHKENETPVKNTSGNSSKTLGKNWIKDNANNIYMQNPSPSEGETISWSGGYVQDGEYKFANGSGTTVWKNKSGEVVQVDEGNFEHGQRQGQFKHQFFPSGNVDYSNWNDGKKIN